MKKIILNDPPKDLMKKLKTIGLLEYHETNDPREENKGKAIPELEVKGLSKKACWGDYSDHVKDVNENVKLHYNQETWKWKQATIELSAEGINRIKELGLEFKVV